MRRIFVVLAGMGIVSTGIACQHTAGKCDCNPITPPCAKYGLFTAPCDAAIVHHSAQPIRDVLVPRTPGTAEALPPAPPAPMPQSPPNVSPPAPPSELPQ